MSFKKDAKIKSNAPKCCIWQNIFSDTRFGTFEDYQLYHKSTQLSNIIKVINNKFKLKGLVQKIGLVKITTNCNRPYSTSFPR